MTRRTVFDEHLTASRFEEARDLLQAELAGGRLLDPRLDPYWPRIADRLAGEIDKTFGTVEVVAFWESMRDFFTDKIEPVWGHAHKGPIYFRLGLASLPHDFVRGKKYLEAAYHEDLALEKTGGGAAQASSQPAYVALTILESIDDSEFANQADKQRFTNQLFHAFNAVMFGIAVQTDNVVMAIKRISPPDGLLSCLAAYRELWEARKQQLSFATVSLTETVLEALLLADLYHRKQIAKLPNGKDLLKVELGPLLEEAIRRSVFPTDSIRVAFQLVHIFHNRLHPGNEFHQTYRLVPRVAWTVSVFFELAVLEWSKTFSPVP